MAVEARLVTLQKEDDTLQASRVVPHFQRDQVERENRVKQD